MLKIVADTNVYISAILFGGICEQIVFQARIKEVDIYISSAIKSEIGNILRREFGWSKKQVHEAISEIDSLTTTLNPAVSLNVIRNDEPDNRVLECAVEGNVDCIVTGDKRHLLSLEDYQGIKIISPARFLYLYRK